MNGSTMAADARPAPRPTPDEITRRAETYERTRDPRLYTGLIQEDLEQFQSEVARLRRLAERQAQDLAYRQAMAGRSAVPS